ncbi:MAG: acyl-CoA dehydratase activase-related protein, partial [Bacteroidales bacterium]
TKIVLIDAQEHILFSYYASNNGNPLEAAKTGIHTLAKECERVGTQLIIKGSCSTGYGEELVRAALSFNTSIIETIAHFTSAKKINPEVSFILDIGGQDMKAIFIDKGTISRMEINEACSSGCGSFIETFAKSLKYTVEDFASAAALAPNPCDLGTRCTVFMNSKVKQFLREGATVADIAAGLSYSVVKNCLYKVLKLKNISELGKHVVLQGGTMKNDSIVGAFEKLLGFSVYRSNIPELMGAYGCALYAKNHCTTNLDTTLEKMLSVSNYLVKSLRCQGCENKCQINEYKFGNANAYYSGNKCETVFSNNQNGKQKGENIYEQKYQKIFGGETPPMDNPVLTIGIPRVLNLYEEYPFWKELLTNCGIRCQLSDPSSFQAYENVLSTVMSDSICFPAKLVHSHIVNLSTKNIDRIFMPYVVYEMKDGKNETNSYNCPIVSGYSEVIRSSMDQITLPIDSPIVSFKDTLLLKKSCLEYLGSLGIVPKVINIAFDKALKRYKQYQIELRELNLAVYAKAKKENKLIILLAGRPYHTDPLIQHKLSQMIASMGITVISDDIVRGDTSIDLSQDIHHVPQWSYINRILKAAKWVAQQGNEVHFVQMTSFGCGPDAFLIDEIKGILHRYGKSATTLKIDDINNMGSLRLRVRSLVESLKIKAITSKNIEPFVSTKAFGKTEKNRTILVPYFTDYLSPLLPSLLTLAGYQIEVLPPSDAKSVEMGLKYANNEVCYPATLIVGDIMKALFSGKYDRSKIAVIITQTGGQCRASNYIALIKSALVSADFADIPVISLSMGSGLNVNQKGFKINWLKILPITLSAILFGDCISKFYHATVVRERKKGEAALLRTSFLQQAQSFILQNDSPALLNLLAHAAQQFNELAEDK